jgi:hypothetical protein
MRVIGSKTQVSHSQGSENIFKWPLTRYSPTTSSLDSLTFTALTAISVKRRVILTGTPVQVRAQILHIGASLDAIFD